MSLRRRTTTSRISPAMREYLTTGDYRKIRNLDVFILARHAMGPRRDLSELRCAWEQHRQEILATWHAPERPWAEQTLAGENT
jgi:hypothetical protein